MNSQSFARGLTFFSFGLGLAELLAPRQVARLIGVDEEDNETLLRLLGAREIAAGAGIMQFHPGAMLWTRVAGDAMDLGLLAAALRNKRNNRNRVIGAMAAVAGVTVLDVAASILLTRNPSQPQWRIARGDRAGFQSEDPVAMRKYADRVMSEHESGHLRDGDSERASASVKSASGQSSDYATSPDETRSRESAASRQFEPGD